MVQRLKDLFVTLTGLVAARSFALITSIIVARIAGAETFGEFTLFVTLFVIVSEVPNSIDTTFIRFSNSSGESGSIGSFQTLAIFFKLIYFMLISIFALFFSETIAGILFNKSEVSEIVKWSFILGAILSVHTLLVGTLQQKKRFDMISLVRPIYGGLILFLVLVSIYLEKTITIDLILYIYFMVLAPLAIISLIVLIPRTIPYFSESIAYYKKFAKVSFFLVFSSLIILVSNRLDIFFITSYMDMSGVGLYGAAIRLSVIVAIVTAAMSTIYIPKAAEAVYDKNLFNEYIKLMLLYGFIQTIIAVVIILNVDHIVVALFGSDYSGIRVISIILIVQVLFEAYSRGFQALVQCGPRPSVFMKISILRLGLSALFLTILTPLYGVTGAALGVMATSIILAFIVAHFAIHDSKRVQV